MDFVIDLLDKLEWETNDAKDAYTFYYYDHAKKLNRGFKYKDVKKILNLYLIISKDGKNGYVPLNRITEVKQGNVIIWKR